MKQGSIPFDLTLDAHANLWFTEFGPDEIGFFNPLRHRCR
jgi:streptogramin lyase